MIRKIIIGCIFIVSHISMAQAQCQPLNVDEYKRTIEAKEKIDTTLPALPKDAYFFKPVIDNCYVSLRVKLPNNNEYDRQYLFDPKGELVNVRPSAGSNIMKCKDEVKNNVDHFIKLLNKKRHENKDIPSKPSFPKTYSVTIRGCLVSLYESYQDDPIKPLIEREWVFDQNGNIFHYSASVRNPKIYPEDKLVK